MKKAAIAAVVIAGLTFSARPASAQACIAGIFFAAFYANATENRELSAKEAATCGIFYGADRDKAVQRRQAVQLPRLRQRSRPRPPPAPSRNKLQIGRLQSKAGRIV